MDQDMRVAVLTVERCVPGLPEPIHAAFADAVFNLGPRIACDTQRSAAARMLKARNLRGACAELPRWDKAKVVGIMVSLPGLTKRRAAERALCESATTTAADAAERQS
jgi:GH24 family phage-related lysozyme (muramidase)